VFLLDLFFGTIFFTGFKGVVRKSS